MDLNKQFGELFDNILDSDKYRKKILKLIQKYHNDKIINSDLALLLIKSLILVLSVNPKKCKLYFKILKLLDTTTITTKENIKSISERFNFSKKNKLLDEDIESIITITLKLLKKIYYICKEQLYSIFYQIINIIIKLTKFKDRMKYIIYKKLINESIIILEKFETKSYLKIVELCGNIYKLINEYLLI